MTEMMLKCLENWKVSVGEDEHKGIKADKLVITKLCHAF